MRVPPLRQRDERALRVLAEVLAGGPRSRLWRRLVSELALATSIRVRLGVPGVKDAHLLVLEATPFPGRTLQELELGIQSELARLLREGISRESVRDAQLRVEATETLLQDDAGTLAEALGQAHIRSGGWQGAFPVSGAGGLVPEASVHHLLRQLLQPSGVVVVSLEPDALTSPQDPAEARLLQRLRERISRAVSDPVTLDSIVRQSLQQLRLLTPGERIRMLQLLESEAP